MEQRATTIGTGGFLDPDDIVRAFDLQKGDHVADFGAGHGYFTIPMARVVGGDGKIYAVDIQRSVLDVIRSKSKTEHLLQIEPMWGNLEELNGSHLKDNFLDFVIIANVLFQAENKETVLKEAYRVLRSGTKLAIVEWSSAAPTAVGPPATLRIEKETTKRIAGKTGFAFDHEFNAGTHHYGLIFKKQ